MVEKQSILCQCHFIINIFLTHVTWMRNVRNQCYAYGNRYKMKIINRRTNSGDPGDICIV